MTDEQQTDSIKAFSRFVDKYPLLLDEIRNSKEPIQSYYEKWALLGEEDPFWNKYQQDFKDENEAAEKSKKTDWIEDILQYSKYVNLEQIQKHVSSISEAVQSLQTIMSQFKEEPNKHKKNNNENLFQLFKD